MNQTINSETFDPSAMMALQVGQKTELAQDIVAFELCRADRSPLPEFSAGAHVLLRTPNGLLRRYSLCNDPAERSRYEIAVKRDEAGSGGSVSMVDNLKIGDLIHVAAPQNYFPLDATATHHLLIAGGIGITPMRAMLHTLIAKGADFSLIYCSRSPEASAFLDAFSAPEFAGRVFLHHDYGDRARSLALGPLLATRTEGSHLYCCGPRPLMQAVREQSKHWPHAAVHFEDFGTSLPVVEVDSATFSVTLARSGVSIKVNPDTSILAAIRKQGISVPSSCESGTCGECRTSLISGIVDHQDFVLDDDEHDKAIMICVSRAKSAELVLDL